MSALAPSRNSYSNNDSSAEQNVARVATNDKENQPHSINKNTNSSNNANRSFGPMKERTQLQKMGALMDQIIMDDNHNHNNHQQQQAEEKAASSNKRNEEVNENDSNNNATSTALSRRRRLTGQLAASLLTPQDSNANGPPAWDGFVRKGTQLKSFLDDALHQVATGYAVTNVVGTKRQRLAEEVADALSSAANKEDGHQSWEERDQAASAVAKEKTSEAILLKQQLEEAQAQVAALTASNDTLREQSAESALRFERTIDALKIAAANAASARTDADQAEASSESLSTQLEALQTVVQETKQASLVLYEEQQEIAEQARAAQAKLLQAETDLARSVKETKQLREQTKEWQDKTKELQGETTALKQQLAEQQEETRKLTKALEEREALENARKERSLQIEKELRDAQALLVDASSVAAEEETLELLRESILELQSANQKLHEKLQEQQETAQEEKERLQESLLEAEKEAQVLRIEASLNSEKRAAERDANGNSNTNQAVSPDAETETSFTISRPTTMNSPDSAAPQASTCSICFKEAFNMMRKCQCGSNDCNLRAHATCAARKNPGHSVSHPGTPGAKLPLILCAGPLAAFQKKD